MTIMWAPKTLFNFGKNKRSGFTIVELLIVIVVIGILAVLVIVGFNAIRNRAYDTSVQNDLSTIAKKIKMYHAMYSVYPAGSVQLAEAGIKVNKGSFGSNYDNGSGTFNLLYCRMPATAPTEFALIAYSRTGNGFQYSKDGTLGKYTGAKTGSVAMCAGAGVTITGSERDWFYDNGAWQSYVAG